MISVGSQSKSQSAGFTASLDHFAFNTAQSAEAPFLSRYMRQWMFRLGDVKFSIVDCWAPAGPGAVTKSVDKAKSAKTKPRVLIKKRASKRVEFILKCSHTEPPNPKASVPVGLFADRIRTLTKSPQPLFVNNHAANILPITHVLVALVDLFQRVGLGDQLVELQLTSLVETEQFWNIRAG
jgi:hypothetical protein